MHEVVKGSALTMRPSRSRMTSSAKSAASARSCVTRTTVLPNRRKTLAQDRPANRRPRAGQERRVARPKGVRPGPASKLAPSRPAGADHPRKRGKRSSPSRGKWVRSASSCVRLTIHVPRLCRAIELTRRHFPPPSGAGTTPRLGRRSPFDVGVRSPTRASRPGRQMRRFLRPDSAGRGAIAIRSIFRSRGTKQDRSAMGRNRKIERCKGGSAGKRLLHAS